MLDFNNAYKELQKLYSNNNYSVAIIRFAISYFMKLQLYKYQLQEGMVYDEIALKERIFFKQKPITAQHLKKLTLKNINDILFILLKQECKLKGKFNFEY